MFPRHPSRPGTVIATVVLAAACVVAGSPAVAQPGPVDRPPSALSADPPDPLAAFRPAPPHERTPERYLPSPSPDPWYSSPPEVDPRTAPGTVLAKSAENSP